MSRMISAALCALLWAGVFATGAMAARPPLPGQKPAELRFEALLRDARNAEALALAERQVQQAQARFGADRPQMAAALNTLADILRRHARYAEAEDRQIREFAEICHADGGERLRSSGDLIGGPAPWLRLY